MFLGDLFDGEPKCCKSVVDFAVCTDNFQVGSFHWLVQVDIAGIVACKAVKVLSRDAGVGDGQNVLISCSTESLGKFDKRILSMKWLDRVVHRELGVAGPAAES